MASDMEKQGRQHEDECCILVKAQPHRSSTYAETVCCAGIGRDGKWRRQYPIPYRILKEGQQFKRWQWIKYKYTEATKDARSESQKVIQETLEVGPPMKASERIRLLNSKIRDSLGQAAALGESLCIVRPTSFEISWKQKPLDHLNSEREKHRQLAAQFSMFDRPAKPLEPCPIEFKVKWSDGDGKVHNHVCDDWETSAAYMNFERTYGREGAIEHLIANYQKYFRAGMVFAFSTHSRRYDQWLLVGMIRLDEDDQQDMFWS